MEFTLSVPFERFVDLEGLIENRKRWRTVDTERSFFEMTWRPKSWTRSYRFVFIRKRVARDLTPKNGSRPYVRILRCLDLKGSSDYDAGTAHGGADYFEASGGGGPPGQGGKDAISVDLKRRCPLPSPAAWRLRQTAGDFRPVRQHVGQSNVGGRSPHKVHGKRSTFHASGCCAASSRYPQGETVSASSNKRSTNRAIRSLP